MEDCKEQSMRCVHLYVGIANVKEEQLIQIVIWIGLLDNTIINLN